MFSTLTLLSLGLAAVSSVSGLVIPRTAPPAGWLTSYLEPYDQYHARYLALDCEDKHGQPFFDQCCHPLLATETLQTARPSQCWPSTPALSSASAALPTTTIVPGDDGDDCDDEPSVTGSAAAAPTSNGDDDDDECDSDDEPATSATAPETTVHISISHAPSTTAPAPIVTAPAENAGNDPPAVSTAKPIVTSSAAPPKETTAEPPKTTEAPVKTTEAPPKTTEAPPKTTAAPPATGTSGLITGGVATFFFQNNTPGACGAVHPDDALIAAIDIDRYGNTGEKSSLCGKKVHITNTKNNKSVTVVIADACPTCNNGNSIDLSVAAFTAIATEDEGEVPIAWAFES